MSSNNGEEQLDDDNEDLDEEFDDERFEEEFDDDFLQLLPGDARLLYDCIVHAVKTNSGIGFHNRDQGHLIYAGVAIEITDETLGEVPDDQELFSMLNRLAGIINKDTQTEVKVFTWPEFCKMAVDAAKQK